jgi:protein-tyrosine phosphatase
MSRLHWIEISAAGRLAIMARPRAEDWLEAELEGWKTNGIDVVIILLDQQEVCDLGLQREADLCRANGIEFVSFPIADRGVPESRHATVQIANSIAECLAKGRSIAVHCRAGIGRSSMIAACAMVCLGVQASQALTRIGKARGLSVPDTDEQRDWILAFGQACQAP